MSHTVTVRTATVNTSTSAVLVNTGFFKTFRGMLKVLQFVLGIACVSIMAVLISPPRNTHPADIPDIFFILMTTTFMVTTGCLIISGLFSISSDLMISKTLFEVVYHVIGFALLLAASLNLLVATENTRKYYGHQYNSDIAASSMGLANAVLYLFSSIFGIRSYRMI